MSKELFVSSTPHETKVAIVEDDQLAEIYFERENEYTLAGSIYKGKVTRVLPGMQSAFVEIGLERDAFLYVTDFVEPQDEDGEIETIPHGEEPQAVEEPSSSELPGESRRGRRGGRAGVGVPDQSIPHRGRFRRPMGEGCGQGNPDAGRLPAGPADGLHLRGDGRGTWICGLPVRPAAILCPADAVDTQRPDGA